MKLTNLLSPKRFLRGTKIFNEPLAAHLEIAAARSQPATIGLKTGGRLSIANMRQARQVFDWLLSESCNPLPVNEEGGLVLFTHGDHRIALRPISTDFYTFKEVIVRDVYELDNIAGPLDTVIDIGTNIGLFSLRVAPLAKKLICVEPVSRNRIVAQHNFRLSNNSKKFSLHDLAVTGKSGENVRIFLSEKNEGGHSISQEHAAQWGETGYEDVKTISLADLFEMEKVDRCSLLKCDVEGAEFEIFENAPLEILSKIDNLLMEIHLTVEAWSPSRLDSLLEKFRHAGLTLRHDPLQTQDGNNPPVIQLFGKRMNG